VTEKKSRNRRGGKKPGTWIKGELVAVGKKKTQDLPVKKIRGGGGSKKDFLKEGGQFKGKVVGTTESRGAVTGGRYRGREVEGGATGVWGWGLQRGGRKTCLVVGGLQEGGAFLWGGAGGAGVDEGTVRDRGQRQGSVGLGGGEKWGGDRT